jgi:hypothetical protein
MKGLLILMAIVGSLFAYTVVDLFIIEMPIGKFLLIELIISLLHLLYNCAKNRMILNL